jgi:hypothetical protein
VISNSNSDKNNYFFKNKEEAFQAASQLASKTFGLQKEYNYCNKYEYASLYGGKNYREWMLTLPDYQASHFTGHYYERNILLHIRTKVRFDTAGRRLLFIEEIQSDWHQAGAKLGYGSWKTGHITNAPFRNDWVGLALKLILMHAVKYDFDAITWTDGSVHQSRYGKTIPMISRLYNHDIPRYLTRLGKTWDAQIEETTIETKEPWLQVVKTNEKCHVRDGAGKFKTKTKYTLNEAMSLVMRHSKNIELKVPMFIVPEEMKTRIIQDGLPMFGDALLVD